jgi:predicted nucleic acid-binding protein
MDAGQAGITSITVMEALTGARNKREMTSIGRSLSRFEHIHFLHQDSQWAIRQFRTFWLSHQVEMADCIIGAIAARTGLPFYTLNMSDFAPLPDVNAVKPY